jgi:peptidoglycan/xylan/chitin deacetylase (PgdA/CDA1 family)
MGLIKRIRYILILIASWFFFRNRSKVIFYHDIHSSKPYCDTSTPIELFQKHIQIINDRGYEIVHTITKKYGQIEICFDDAYLGLYENIKFLRDRNIPVHLFVISSYLNSDGYISKQQLLELSKLDIVKISSHTHTHSILNQIDEDDVVREFKHSMEIIEALIGTSIDSICYPEGKFNRKSIHIAKLVGYKKQYSSLPGFFSNKFANNVIKRSLVQSSGEKEFKAILKGGDHILAIWYRLKHFKK